MKYTITCKKDFEGAITLEFYKTGQLKEAIIKAQLPHDASLYLYRNFPVHINVLDDYRKNKPEWKIEDSEVVSFDSFWKEWADSRGKAEAEEAWKKCVKRKEHYLAYHNRSKYENRRLKQNPVPAHLMASTYLNKRIYMDFVDVESTLFD